MTHTPGDATPPASVRVLAINPNTNPTVTQRVREVLQAQAPPGVIIEAVSPPHGPRAVENGQDKTRAANHVMALIQSRLAQGYAGYILACFDDIAVADARALTGAPVVSLAEAGIRRADATGGPFTVITTFAGAVATIESLCEDYGVRERCRVVATGIGVSDTAARTPEAEARLARLCEQARAEGARAIVLGSGAFAGRGEELAARHGLPVMDGFAEALAFVLHKAQSAATQDT
ncbi:aspartate/glutamate racemase family protein [Halomonas mongoliensis]|uniref:Aspartate/glutamate racemase family protein n=1 Tax=Halomonas mongoliensis TaxID=321265 RepID=A0ABU1GLA7_9GAMM|nr:aspartate/glutamate racemase family protein [Halomonas mongoliensis]MDR5892796.1 aspartate/glutamate racemase family protein [Halomonas mongoliensis]